MKNDSDIHRRSRKIFWIISLVFIVLAASLHILTLLYWDSALEPRLRREAQSQADILAHSQAARLADVLILNEPDKRFSVLQETTNEVLLLSGPETETKTPFFLGLDLDLDYEVVSRCPTLHKDR